MTLQRAQTANDENIFLLRKEVRATKDNLENLQDAVNGRLQTLEKSLPYFKENQSFTKNVPENKRKISSSSERFGMFYLIWVLFTLT